VIPLSGINRSVTSQFTRELVCTRIKPRLVERDLTLEGLDDTCHTSHVNLNVLKVCRPNLPHSCLLQPCAGNQQEATYSEVKKPLKGKKKQNPVAGVFSCLLNDIKCISCNVLIWL